MSTVYTVNGKVLKNSANDKWLAKKEAPAGFVMDASNAQYYTSGGWTYLYWNGPSFPNGYDGGGKQCIIVNNSSQGPSGNLMYTNDSLAGGPDAIKSSNLVTGTTTMIANVAGAASGYGKYFCIPFHSEEDARSWVANVTITILDQ